MRNNSTKYKNYHVGDFKEILKLIEKKQYNNALILYENYFEQYPNDYPDYILYIGLLIKLGKLDEALIKFNNINISEIKDPLTIDSYIFNQIKLYSHLSDFQKAYVLLISNKDMFLRNDWGYSQPKLFLKKQLGLLTEADYEKEGYVISQIVDYSEDKLFEHLNKHIYSNECDSSCCFVENFPIKEVILR